MWLNGWAYRIRFEIDRTKIDSALTDFPVTIRLKSACGINGRDATHLFSVMDYTKRLKIQFIADNHYRCFAEIERWDDATKEAVFHVCLPSVKDSSSTTNTILDMYYDPRQRDWDIVPHWYFNETFNDGMTGETFPTERYKLYSTSYTYQNGRLSGGSDSTSRSLYSKFIISGDFEYQVDWEVITNPSTNNWIGYTRFMIDYNHYVYVYRGYVSGSGRMEAVYANGGSESSFANVTTAITSSKFKITRTGSTFHCYYYNAGWVELGTGCTINSNPGRILFERSVWSGAPNFQIDWDNFSINSAGSVSGFIGDQASFPAQAVWDNNYMGVWHMNNDPGAGAPQLKDSVFSNLHNGTSYGMASGDLVDGKIGKGTHFDGADGEYNIAVAFQPTDVTIEAVIKPAADNGVVIEHNSWRLAGQWSMRIDTNGTRLIWSTYPSTVQTDSYATLTVGDYHHVAGTKTGTTQKLYLNGAEADSDTCQTGGFASSTAQKFNRYDLAMDLTMDEVRISQTARSAAWMKATYNSLWDTLLYVHPYEEVFEDASRILSIAQSLSPNFHQSVLFYGKFTPTGKFAWEHPGCLFSVGVDWLMNGPNYGVGVSPFNGVLDQFLDYGIWTYTDASATLSNLVEFSGRLLVGSLLSMDKELAPWDMSFHSLTGNVLSIEKEFNRLLDITSRTGFRTVKNLILAEMFAHVLPGAKIDLDKTLRPVSMSGHSLTGNILSLEEKFLFEMYGHLSHGNTMSLDKVLHLIQESARIISGNRLTIQSSLGLFQLSSRLLAGALLRLSKELTPVNFEAYLRVLSTLAAGKTIVVNTELIGVTEFDDYGFKGYGEVNGRNYGALPSGIFVLEGADDNGSPIQTSLTSPKIDLNTGIVERMREVWFALEADGNMRITLPLTTNTFSEVITHIPDRIDERRSVLPKGMKERYFQFTLENVDGSASHIDSMRLLAEPIKRRKR